MKHPLVRAVLAVPLALSACLTEPEPGPEPPEDEPGVAPTRPIERPAAPPLVVEREYRVAGVPTYEPVNPGAPGWLDAIKNSDALAITGTGDVHVISRYNWHHFAAGGGPPMTTYLHQQDVFELPFAVVTRAPDDAKPYIAANQGRYLHPTVRRYDPTTRAFDASCDLPTQANSVGTWRLTAAATGFHVTGRRAVGCQTDLTPTFVQEMSGQVRHPYTWSSAGATLSLEVSTGDATRAYTELRNDAGGPLYKTEVQPVSSGWKAAALWGAVETGASTGYALVADWYACSPTSPPPCPRSGYSIVPVSMANGTHGARYESPRLDGTTVGGMMLIDPLSHDLIVLTSHWNNGTAVTEVARFGSDLERGISYELGDAIVHDAILVGDELYISLFTPGGTRLQVTDLNGAQRGDVVYGAPGDYPMALKKSFDGVPYLLTREGNQLVVRKLARDTDGDGLPDRWETAGIDADNDGTIDFALHQIPGISPLRKNILVEVDAAAGVTDPRVYWSQIHQMFLAAPVENPDGSTGIVATLLPSEMDFPYSDGPMSMEDEAAYDEGKLGDPAEIDLPNHTAILRARRLATRHVMIFPYRQTQAGPLGTVHLFGRTFGLPGQAASFVAIYDDLGALTPIYNVLTVDQRHTVRASIFAHELGHALGLQHGGHENVRRKPTYHSAMNELHMIPRQWPVVPVLRYADGNEPTLVEDRLDEEQGLDMGPDHEAHIISFMTGQPGGPNHQVHGFETTFGLDFDGDGTIESGLVSADVNRDGMIGTLEVRSDWLELDWSLSRSPAWDVRDQAHSAMLDDTESLLVGGGWCDPFAAPGCTCMQDGQTRPCGTDAGACTAGVQTCTGGFWGLCEGSVPAWAERCNAADDDCDGIADDDFPTLGQACTAGVGACARSGAQVCTADELGTACSAVAGAPITERCSNSADDDCDGATDEGFPTIGQACTAGLGVCRRDGTLVCAADGVSAVCSATAGTPIAEVCGNGLDDDCDGLTDDDCVPTPISPPAGHLTGSGRVVSAAGQYNPRQVTFRWAATTPGASYDVQIDDDATFSSPVPFIPITSTSYTTGDLPTAGSVPWGTRYHWRVRSRVGAGPWSAWSAASYVDVGRLPDDTNGDGYADVLVGATNAAHTTGVTGEGAVFSYHGRSGVLPSGSPARTIDDPNNQTNARFGSAIALTDMDADGYTDTVVGVPGRTVGNLGNSGAFIVYFGSASGMSTTPGAQFSSPVPETGAGFGAAIAPAGDVDGDGYADVWVAAPDQDVMIFWNNRFTMQPSVGAAYLYRGGPRAAFPTAHVASRVGWAPYARFGAAMRSVGDVDNDGRTDMAFAAAGSGNVFVYRGGSTTLLANLTQAGTVNFGRDLASGDFDGDGGVDLAVTMTSPAGFSIFRKSGATLTTSPWYADVGGPSAWDAYIASGDLDRDGDADLALGYPSISPGGRVVVYVCGPNPGIPGHWTDSQSYAELGRSLTLADTSGDGRHDVFAGAPRASMGATREGKMLGWSMVSSPAFGHAPTVIYDSARNQAEGWFGQTVR